MMWRGLFGMLSVRVWFRWRDDGGCRLTVSIFLLYSPALPGSVIKPFAQKTLSLDGMVNEPSHEPLFSDSIGNYMMVIVTELYHTDFII